MTVATEDSLIAQRILEAAVHLFAHKGYDATSIREITEAAGVTKPMLYYYFENKEGLCRAIFARFLEQHHSRLREVLERETDPFELLVGVVWGALDICRENMDFARLFLALYFSPEAQVGGVNLCEAPKEGLTLLEEAGHHRSEGRGREVNAAAGPPNRRGLVDRFRGEEARGRPRIEADQRN